MVDHTKMKLGKLPPRHDGRTLQLARYMKALPPPPAAVDWTKGITAFGMMLNDALGDCTIAGCGHAVQIWTANLGAEITVPDPTVEQFYEEWDGYDPADPSTDQGGVELDVLNSWRQGGFAGHILTGFADPHPANLEAVRQAIEPFRWRLHRALAPRHRAEPGSLGCRRPNRPKRRRGQLGRPLRFCPEVRPERLQLYHLGRPATDDDSFLDGVLRRSARAFEQGLAGREGLAGWA